LVFGVIHGSDVIDLTPNSFKSQVLDSEIPFLVEFFAPWCGHCQRLAPEWEKAATNLKGIVPLGKVDCTVHQSLCSQYQVQGYPTIKVFSQKGKKVEDYQQARQATAIVGYATDSLPNNVVNVKDLASLNSFLAANSDIPHLLLFTSKSEVPPLLKSLSTSFKGRVAFGQVKEDNREIVQKYGVDSFPKILIIKGEEDPIIYDGAINAEELREFVVSYASETASSVPPPPSPPPVTRQKAQTSVSYVQLTADNLESECTGYCIIGFVDKDSGETPQVQADHKKLLDDIGNSFKKDGKFKFGWVDKKTEDSLVKKFSLDPNEPALIVFHPKRSRFVNSPAFEFTSAFRIIEHVLTGDAHWENIKQPQTEL